MESQFVTLMNGAGSGMGLKPRTPYEVLPWKDCAYPKHFHTSYNEEDYVVIKGEPYMNQFAVVKEKYYTLVVKIVNTEEDLERAKFGIFHMHKSYVEEYRGAELSKKLGII